jgi:hypothetical protein
MNFTEGFCYTINEERASYSSEASQDKTEDRLRKKRAGLRLWKLDEEDIICGGNMEVCCWRMTPEDEARQLIDGLLKAAGWEIWDYRDYLRKDAEIKQPILFTTDFHGLKISMSFLKQVTNDSRSPKDSLRRVAETRRILTE